MVVLGIDPGYAIVGWGVIEYNGNAYRPLAFGSITTEAHTDFNFRLELIYNDMMTILKKYKPDALSIEKLFFTTNVTTAILVAQARGVILLAAQQCGVKVFEYTPLQVKVAVTGYGKARKPQVMEMTRRLLHLKEVPKPDDTADALAIAITHTHACGSKLRRDLYSGGVKL
ncbi:MAG: crossover junction endodeoxyribonuclease RuvC [Ruminococcus sp.]|nr:crossover junction endodeoxyribonuclease RuvC [Ruminococcus sp.]